MDRRFSHPFDALAERFAQIFAERVSAALPKTGRNGVARNAGSLERDMSCRYPGCKNRSNLKGPPCRRDAHCAKRVAKDRPARSRGLPASDRRTHAHGALRAARRDGGGTPAPAGRSTLEAGGEARRV